MVLNQNGQKFLFKRTEHVKYNKYGRTEEMYECESYERCPHKQELITIGSTEQF